MSTYYPESQITLLDQETHHSHFFHLCAVVELPMFLTSSSKNKIHRHNLIVSGNCTQIYRLQVYTFASVYIFVSGHYRLQIVSDTNMYTDANVHVSGTIDFKYIYLHLL